MKLFGNLFGKKSAGIPDELVFKSNCAALEYELKFNPCSNPTGGDLVMGVVLQTHSRKDGVQCAHVVTNIISKHLDEKEVETWLPGLESGTLPSELMELAKGDGTIIPNACCTDHVPYLKIGDFVAVQVTMVMPSGMSMGIIVQAAQPILHSQYGWKSR